jgi:plastocyanin
MRVIIAAAVLLLVTGCSKSTSSSGPATTAGTPLSPPPSATAAQLGTVTGTAAPGAIVLLEPKARKEFPPPETAVMDQVSLTFTPPMLFVRTGHAVEFRNSDDTLHNVHVDNSDTREPAFNVAIPTGEVYKYTFPKDGFYHVACDIHPAMSAEIFSASTPFVTAAEGDGTFAFADVPPGQYIVRTFAGGTKSDREVEIKGGVNQLAPEG